MDRINIAVSMVESLPANNSIIILNNRQSIVTDADNLGQSIKGNQIIIPGREGSIFNVSRMIDDEEDDEVKRVTNIQDSLTNKNEVVMLNN